MKFKDKLLIQIVACLTIIAIINGTPLISNEKINDLKKEVIKQINKDYSIEEIKEIKTSILSAATNAPDFLNQVITVANEIGYFTYPIDEDSKDEIINVRAAAGGEVIYSGIDKELGPCIRIKHEGKISTYGHLHTIEVIVGDRVKKAQKIGTYNNKSTEEFYYQLEDSMV